MEAQGAAVYVQLFGDHYTFFQVRHYLQVKKGWGHILKGILLVRTAFDKI